MSEFRTVLTPKKQENQIDYQSKVMLFGSCFTEHINQKLEYFKFDTLPNPFGIVFNSSAIYTAVNHCVINKVYAQADLNQHGELWFSFNHHSQFSSANLAQTLAEINSNISKAHQFLKKATHIVITLGTAWIYRYNDTAKIVANCHKIPQQKFTKSLQSIAAITNDLDGIYTAIKTINPKVNMLFTVSPIRHLRNGFAENNLSKAHLIAAIQQHVSQQKDCFYMPIYELMMDDLRDYRFYEADMIHPNATALNYIWDFFKARYLSDKATPLMKEIDRLQKDLQHRPFNRNTDAYREFRLHLDEKMAKLTAQHPSIKF